MNGPVIIGGGISGLSAANYFIDNDIKPIIIETDVIGRTKVCGEFFSYEAIPFLQKWNIPFLLIEKNNFHTKSNQFSFKFPTPSASSSRSMCELKLARRAVSNGADLFTNTKVLEIIPAKTKSENHVIKLDSGKIIETQKLIITTGRLPFLTKKFSEPNYIGIKAHFKNIIMPNELNMFISKCAYLGATYIDDSTVNICCLAQKKLVNEYPSIDEFMHNFINSHPKLNEYLKSSTKIDDWLTASISQFGKKEVPNWPNTYFIGDAIATIFPAAGNGLSMGLTAGVMAAHHIIFDEQTDFNKDWHMRYNSRLQYANLLHSIFISSKSDLAFKIAKLIPSLPNIFYKLTRD